MHTERSETDRLRRRREWLRDDMVLLLGAAALVEVLLAADD